MKKIELKIGDKVELWNGSKGAPVTYGCPQCGSKNYKEEGNNHHQTDDEMEYLEYYKCQDCGHGFV